MFGFISKKKHNQQLRDAQRILQHTKNQLRQADQAYLNLAEKYRKLCYINQRNSFRP